VVRRAARIGVAQEHARRGDPLRLTRWEGLARFLDDGRIEIDSNPVERLIRPIALNRKKRAVRWLRRQRRALAIRASLIETCKLNAIDPQVYLAEMLAPLGIPSPVSTSACPGPGPLLGLLKGPRNSAYVQSLGVRTPPRIDGCHGVIPHRADGDPRMAEISQ
jgi:hypothetical protein